jgi:hypothetical protein
MWERLIPVGTHKQITGLTVVKSIRIPSGASGVLMQTEAGEVHYTLDGVTAPTATLGFRMALGAVITLRLRPGTLVQFFQTQPNAVLDYQFIDDNQAGG